MLVHKQNKAGGDYRHGHELSWEGRLEILRLHVGGGTTAQIAKETKRSRGCVTKIVDWFERTGLSSPRPIRGRRPPKLRLPELLYLKVSFTRLFFRVWHAALLLNNVPRPRTHRWFLTFAKRSYRLCIAVAHQGSTLPQACRVCSASAAGHGGPRLRIDSLSCVEICTPDKKA